MGSVVLLDAAGRRQSVATLPGHHVITAAARRATRACAIPPIRRRSRRSWRSCVTPAIAHGLRLRGPAVVMSRAGLRISEALALTESDLDEARGAILVRHGKNDKRREVGMDSWGWELLRPWLAYRVQIPVGLLFGVIDGRTRGRPLVATSVRQQLRRTAAKPGFGGALRRISFVMRARSRWPERACRSTSSSASSGTRTSASHRCT